MAKKYKFQRKKNDGAFAEGTALSYQGILDAAEASIVSIHSWVEHACLASALKAFHNAEALIEILEVHNCGSVGGFDAGQLGPRSGIKGLEDRWIWLNKHRRGKETNNE